MLDKEGISFPEAIEKLQDEYEADLYTWASYGAYDLNMLKKQCQLRGIKYPMGSHHINVKEWFSEVKGLRKKVGMNGALEILNIPLEVTSVNNPSNSSTNILLVLGIAVLAIRIIPLLIKNTAPLDINMGTPMLLVIIAFVVILGFLFFNNSLTFGKGTFWQKIIINACLITAIYQLLNPVFTHYKTSIFLKILISAFSIYIIYKVYNLYSNFLKSK